MLRGWVSWWIIRSPVLHSFQAGPQTPLWLSVCFRSRCHLRWGREGLEPALQTQMSSLVNKTSYALLDVHPCFGARKAVGQILTVRRLLTSPASLSSHSGFPTAAAELACRWHRGEFSTDTDVCEVPVVGKATPSRKHTPGSKEEELSCP